MISNLDAQQFTLLFQGKNNTYVKNELPKEAPKNGEKIKTKITQVEGKVDKELLAMHLNGKFGVGICPVNNEGKVKFCVIDIDCYDSRVFKMLNFIQAYNLPLLPFRSKSGGLHVYMMFSKPVTARTARELCKEIIWYFNLEDIYGKTKVEIFPKQDIVKENGFGNGVTLPYFNGEDTYTPLLDTEGNAIPFKEALVYIQKHITSVEKVKEVLEHLPYDDAPPCLQRALLTFSIGSEDSGRNNFLFSYAVYAKKKYGTGFESYVSEINDSFEVPLEENVIEQICNSVKENEYYYKCKDEPCLAFCDKTICHKREFGLGKDKGRFTGIEYGQLYRYKTAEPYYIWKLRLLGQEQWKDVIFKDEGYLLDQRNFAKMCIRYLNSAPMIVSTNDWNAILNSVLPNVQDVEVKQESDTSGLSMIKFAFTKYLANKQARRDMPQQIRVNLCVRRMEGGVAKYYFTHIGFAEFLKNQKITFDFNMLRETLIQFGAKEDVLVYEDSLGEERRFPCWSKSEDAVIEDAYNGAMEVEEGDKKAFSVASVGDASNVEEYEPKAEEEKPYTEKDLKEGEELF